MNVWLLITVEVPLETAEHHRWDMAAVAYEVTQSDPAKWQMEWIDDDGLNPQPNG